MMNCKEKLTGEKEYNNGDTGCPNIEKSEVFYLVFYNKAPFFQFGEK